MNKTKYLNETFPIYHTGYMSGRDVFSVLVCAGFVKELEDYIEKENICILNEKVLKSFYRGMILQKAVFISEEVISLAGSNVVDSRKEFGIFGMILRFTDWTLMVGSFAYDLFSTIQAGKDIYRCTAAELGSGRIVLLDFIEADSVTELARIVRYSVYRLEKMDITGSSPRVQTDKIKAVRPPFDEWGMIIYR